MEFIEALNEIPAALWTLLGTLFGAALGVFGTLRVEKFRQKAEREKADIEYRRAQENALEERLRTNYLEVISLARELREGTGFERVTVRQSMPWSEENHEATRSLMAKVRNLNTAILRASVESPEGARRRLKALHVAANDDISLVLSTDADAYAKQSEASDEAFAAAINEMDKFAHSLFDPDLVFPSGQGA